MASLAAKDEELAQGVAALATKDEEEEEEEEEVTIAVGGKRVFLGTQLTAAAFNAANSTAALRSSADALDCTGFRLWTDCTTRAIKFVEGCCEVSGRRVLELGCGAHAALATACAELGAAATATDGKDETVARARRNFALRRARDPKCKHVAFETLRWGGASAEKRYDLVVGSELMYFSTPIDDLVATIAARLKPKTTTTDSRPPFALLCHIYRDAALPERLASAAAAAGLACLDFESLESDNSRLHVLCWQEDSVKIVFHVPELEFCRTLADVLADDSTDDEAALLGVGADEDLWDDDEDDST
jgi:SAM-dependent methyltransferase